MFPPKRRRQQANPVQPKARANDGLDGLEAAMRLAPRSSQGSRDFAFDAEYRAA
jgi:hypothetical protein